jgi:DNA-binding NarL/FixJ family response regulator
MDSLTRFCEALACPVKVAVIEIEPHVISQIREALSVYNCDVEQTYEPSVGCRCRQNLAKADLIFLADNITGNNTSLDIAKQISICCPNASVVILTRNPQSKQVTDLMKSGVYTFLVKNGSFNQTHVRRVFNQLNLRLREHGRTATSVETKSCLAQV